MKEYILTQECNSYYILLNLLNFLLFLPNSVPKIKKVCYNNYVIISFKIPKNKTRL